MLLGNDNNIEPIFTTSIVPIPPLPECALLFDIDGTLIDLAPTPDTVHVPPELKQALADLYERTGGAVALVSGRSLADIDTLFHPLKMPAIGGHGAEFRLDPQGAAIAAEVKIETNLKKRFAAIANLSSHILLEDKGYSMAIHYRLAPSAEGAIYKAVAAIQADLSSAPIEVLTGKCVVEIKPAGFSKATAVRELMSRPPYAGRHPVFIGDDVTDDTVFAIMPDLAGTAFSVGRRVVGLQGYFAAPADVREWLSGLLRISQPARVRQRA